MDVMEKNPRLRLPRIHVDLLIEIARELGPKPRFVIAKELQRRIDVTQKTSLDYVNSAVNEGILNRAGMNLYAPELQPRG